VNYGDIQLILGDALDSKYDYLLTQSTVIFMNNVCFNAELEQKLIEKYVTLLADGCKVISIKELFPRYRPNSSKKKLPC